MANQGNSSKPELVRMRAMSQGDAYLTFPYNAHPHGIQFIFKDFDYSTFVVNKRGLNSINLKPQVKGTRSIELPFPKTLTDQTGVRLVSFERNFLTERIAASIAGQMGASASGTVGNIATKAAEMIQSIGAGIVRDPSGVFDMIKNGIMNVSNEGVANAARLATFIIRNFLPDEIGKTTGAITGTAINPNETLAFEGVNLKNYTFSWDLFPSNGEESRRIEQIIRLCKSEALPRYSDGGLTSLGPLASAGIDIKRIFLKYPSVVIINLVGVKPTSWMRFKPAMITDITVDYAAGGAIGVMQGGVPAGVNLSMSFSELSIHTAEDYDIASFMGPLTSDAIQGPTG